MGLSGCRLFVSLALLLAASGCAGVGYRQESSLVHTRYATLENFGDEPITAEQIDDLLEEVAEILDLSLSPGIPKVRIMVTSPTQIAQVYRQVVSVARHDVHARALYIPGASLVMIPYYERTILGHELAHYLTDHYLKRVPRRSWEQLAYFVEDSLPAAPRVATRRAPVPDRVAVWPVMAPARHLDTAN